MISLRLPYLNMDLNTYAQKRRSFSSIFRTLFKKKSFGHKKLLKIYKQVGIKPNVTVRYNKAPLTVFRSFNSLSRRLDERFFYIRLAYDSKELLKKRKNLKYYLAINNLPRNGQRTRNNGKTAKRLGFYKSIDQSTYVPRKKRVERKDKKIKSTKQNDTKRR